MGVSNNFYLSLLIGLGWVLLTFGVIVFGIITISRYLLAQSFDRFLPTQLSYVSPRYRSPVLARVPDLVITVSLIGLASYYYGNLASLYGKVLASIIYFAFVGLAAVIYSVRSGMKQEHRLLLMVCGVLQVAVFIYLSYGFITFNGPSGSIYGANYLAYGYIIATFVAGAAIYFVSKWRNSEKGIKLSLAFREIPPE